MQKIKNVTIEIVGNRLQIDDYYYFLLQSGDVAIWHIDGKQESAIYQDSMESATAYVKTLHYKTDDLGGLNEY